MTLFEWLSVITACGMPISVFVMSRVDRGRDQWREGLGDRLNHLDDCIDQVKTMVMSNTVTKTDLAAFEVNFRAVIDQHRLAIGQDTNGLHQRVFRLENHALRGD